MVAQQEVDHKTNEIKLFRPPLKDLDLTGCVVTADARHAQVDHAEFLVEEKHADFFLFVKQKQPSLYNEVVCLPDDRFSEAHTDVSKGHGRTGTRTIGVAAAPAGLAEFPHVAAVARVEREVSDAKTGELRWTETAWAVTPASPRRAGPPPLLVASREHWGIENGALGTRRLQGPLRVRAPGAGHDAQPGDQRAAPGRRHHRRPGAAPPLPPSRAGVQPPRPMTPTAQHKTGDDHAGRPGPDHGPPPGRSWSKGLAGRRPVSARYHGQQRLLCPHALGWKNGRAKVLAYQADGTTSHRGLPADPRQRWRSLFIDEIEDPTITDEAWQTADNYTPASTRIDELEIDINTFAARLPRTGGVRRRGRGSLKVGVVAG